MDIWPRQYVMLFTSLSFHHGRTPILLNYPEYGKSHGSGIASHPGRGSHDRMYCIYYMTLTHSLYNAIGSVSITHCSFLFPPSGRWVATSASHPDCNSCGRTCCMTRLRYAHDALACHIIIYHVEHHHDARNSA